MQRVVACLLRRATKVLVGKRPSQKRHGGLWEFPGGKTEAGETDQQAALRELREELGILDARVSESIFEVHDHEAHFTIAFLPVETVDEPVALEHAELKWAD